MTRQPMRRDETAMSTAEYAVGTVGACTIAGVLVHLGGQDWFVDLIQSILRGALSPRGLLDLVPVDVPRVRLR
ncbi:hypothetical protein GCM10009821_22620 [Aeromicrobium halocynthiae]|uniref:DUF4244 domain-containing protein n=1 Tax=Aeromicrobium halocynthiae TaxID=560557 RepID=A0ABN2W5T0_9ACTN